jgi:hypothetical protein
MRPPMESSNNTNTVTFSVQASCSLRGVDRRSYYSNTPECYSKINYDAVTVQMTLAWKSLLYINPTVLHQVSIYSIVCNVYLYSYCATPRTCRVPLSFTQYLLANSEYFIVCFELRSKKGWQMFNIWMNEQHFSFAWFQIKTGLITLIS